MVNYKKFTVAGVCAAALALTACTPPNENPSDQKVDTGSTMEAPSSSEEATPSESESENGETETGTETAETDTQSETETGETNAETEGTETEATGAAEQ